jgi:hypothetical protein
MGHLQPSSEAVKKLRGKRDERGQGRAKKDERRD